MVTTSRGRRRARAGRAGAALAALAAVLVSLLALSACGTATASGPPDASVDPGGHLIGLSPSPSPSATSTPPISPISPIQSPDHATLVVIARAGAPILGMEVIRTPTPAGLVDLTSWVRVERVITGSARVGQQLRIFQMVRQGVQMQAANIPVPVGVLPRLVSGRVYELWLRPLTMNEKSVAGTWMVVREQPVTTS